ncbi:DNA primase [Bacillus kwashiorkori]|uniref:DNA primase n=1 Tax=Bacillus kwashiorkori TaxID=1522318 RepID=UPI000780416F|nr:DNA primase [Bacillus kwashiorkori]
MAERIPEEKINEIRQAVDIVDVISEYVQLKKHGRNYFGLCPFHGEKTPSFSVSPEKQIYHCFGCGAGGNVYSFLMDIDGISFQEATIKLAQLGNVELDIREDQFEKLTSKNSKQQQMIEAHELLRKFYHHILMHTKDGQEALEYLYKRGFTNELIETFQIGYSLNSWDMDYQFLTKRGFSEQLLERSGLVIKSENETFFDRFRNRIMFPIFDSKGNTIAFSGRAIIDQDQPKYLNSPETDLFHKGKIFYNFHRARPNIRKKQMVVVFEGFADCISAYQAGVDYGIATMGTALTEEHISLIKRTTNQVILCFDSDSAGQTATIKAGETLFEAGCQVYVAVVPENKDPDEYIKKNGAEAFRNKVMDAKITFMAFKYEYFQKGKNLQKEGDRLKFIEEVLIELGKLTNAVEVDLYLRKLAEQFSLSLDALQKQLRKFSSTYKNKLNRQKSYNIDYLSVKKQDKKNNTAYYNAERMLIAHMLKNVQLTWKVQEMLGEQSLNFDEHQTIITYLYAFYEAGNEPDLSHFLTFVNDSQIRNLISEIGMLQINEEISDKELSDYIHYVTKYHQELTIQAMLKEAKKAELEQDFEKAKKIALEMMQLKKML